MPTPLTMPASARSVHVARQLVFDLERVVGDGEALLVDERQLVGEALADGDDLILGVGRPVACRALRSRS